eukprot:m51a1_g8306 putative dna mismatch repair protein mlh1 isoform x1 (883) ;mRNA; r:64520-68326
MSRPVHNPSIKTEAPCEAPERSPGPEEALQRASLQEQEALMKQLEETVSLAGQRTPCLGWGLPEVLWGLAVLLGPPEPLDECVVNRIAAGEVIHRPANAVKEMIENSLDARSSNITVVAKAGGTKLLQIQDNGHGIAREDFALLCERFATSKLQKFEDLQQISTFGFRGEALASISHVAHFKVVSMHEGAKCAYKASFEDGAMLKPQGKSAPEPCAGVKGTTMIVEDLFYNVPLRLKALKNVSDEYTKIVELVSRYALHNSGVAFTCKKHGENTSEVHTAQGASVQDNVRAIFGHAVARELVEFQCSDEALGLGAKGLVSNPNYNVRKTTFILFINNRLVDCAPLKKALDSVYSQYLPKGTHAWMYIGMQLRPQDLDVNVHPTKSEVRFLHETEVIEALQRALSALLAEHNSSRAFGSQNQPLISAAFPASPVVAAAAAPPSLAPAPSAVDGDDEEQQSRGARVGGAAGDGEAPTQRWASSKSLPQHKMVRTEAQQRTLDAFTARPASVQAQSQASSAPQDDAAMDDEPRALRHAQPAQKRSRARDSDDDEHDEPQRKRPSTKERGDDEPVGDPATPVHSGGCAHCDAVADAPADDDAPAPAAAAAAAAAPAPAAAAAAAVPDQAGSATDEMRRRPRKYKPCSLTSVQKLQAEFVEGSHAGLEEVLGDSVFVGLASASFAMFQHRTKLYLCDVLALSKELMYQQALLMFANFDRLVLRPPLSLRELLRAAHEDGADDEVQWEYDTLMRVREMVGEYFAIELTEEGMLRALPQLVEGYVPDMARLPAFLSRVASGVEWQFEYECFKTMARQLGEFYTPSLPPAAAPPSEGPEAESACGSKQHEWTVEQQLFPAIRKLLYPPKAFANDGTVASLENLYKVFERC